MLLLLCCMTCYMFEGRDEWAELSDGWAGGLEVDLRGLSELYEGSELFQSVFPGSLTRKINANL